MRLTPETIDAALEAYWGTPWRECVNIGPDDDPESFAFKLTCLDPATCEACETIWEDADLEFNRRLNAYICPTCQAWPGSWSA